MTLAEGDGGGGLRRRVKKLKRWTKIRKSKIRKIENVLHHKSIITIATVLELNTVIRLLRKLPEGLVVPELHRAPGLTADQINNLLDVAGIAGVVLN